MDPSSEGSLFSESEERFDTGVHPTINPKLSDIRKLEDNLLQRQDSLDLTLQVLKENTKQESEGNIGTWANTSQDMTKLLLELSASCTPTLGNSPLNTPSIGPFGSPNHNPLFQKESTPFAELRHIQPQTTPPSSQGSQLDGFDCEKDEFAAQAKYERIEIDLDGEEYTSPGSVADSYTDQRAPSTGSTYHNQDYSPLPSYEVKRESSATPPSIPDPCRRNPPRKKRKSISQVKLEPGESLEIPEPRKYTRKSDPEKDNPDYQNKRAKNNVAVRKSRAKAKLRVMEIQRHNTDLEQRYKDLQNRFWEKEKEVETLKEALAAALGQKSKSSSYPRLPQRY